MMTRKLDPYRVKPVRPQPIRDAILRFLSQPRSAGQIAEHIERPVPTATGHLHAMIALGLARRIAHGTYAPHGYSGPDIRVPSRRSQSSRAVRKAVRAHLSERHNAASLHRCTGIEESAIRLALRDLWFGGLLEGNETTDYCLVARAQKFERERQNKSAIRKITG